MVEGMWEEVLRENRLSCRTLPEIVRNIKCMSYRNLMLNNVIMSRGTEVSCWNDEKERECHVGTYFELISRYR